MTELAGKTCVPCTGDTPRLEDRRVTELRAEVPEWEVVENHHLIRTFRFKNFREALDFVNRIGEVAEEEGHHPDIGLGWGRVEVTVLTHAIDGLSENDFILAAKISQI